MGKTAFVFSGQENCYCGMGRDFYDNEEASRDIFDAARRATGLDIPALCFKDQKSLANVEYSGIAVVTVEIAIMNALRQAGIRPQANCGINMGYYSAMFASGAMAIGDAFRLVRKLGIYMQEAFPTGGAIARITGLHEKTLTRLVEKAGGRAYICEYDCPDQMVVSGEKAPVKEVVRLAQAEGAERAAYRSISLPYCTELMKSAEYRMEAALETVEFNFFKIPFMSNVTGDFVYSPEEVAPLLLAQVCQPMRFQKSIEHLIFEGFTDFVCIGPGRETERIIRKIYSSARAVTVEDHDDFKKAVKLYSK